MCRLGGGGSEVGKRVCSVPKVESSVKSDNHEDDELMDTVGNTMTVERCDIELEDRSGQKRARTDELLSSSAGRVSKPLILLDVDGVLNSRRMKRLWKDSQTTDYMFVINASGDEDLLQIQYSPSMVSIINSWESSGLAEIRWLTSWNGQANTLLSPAIGISQFPLARETNGVSKLDAFLSNIDEADSDRLIIWIDDALTHYKKDFGRDVKYKGPIFSRSSTVMVAPLSGLSKHHVEYVERILKNPTAYRGKRCIVNFEAGNRGLNVR